VIRSANSTAGAGKAPASSLIPDAFLSYQAPEQIYLRLSILACVIKSWRHKNTFPLLLTL